MIWECDEGNCERAVCSNCVKIPSEELSKLRNPNVKFTCPACHWSWKDNSTPYLVSAFSVYCTKMFLFIFIYKGFTIGGKPVLKTFLKVEGFFETSLSAKVISPPTILIHLRLHSIRHISHFTIVDQLLSEFYSDNSLRVVDLPFDVGSNQAAAKWNDGITELVTGLPGYKHVVVFITTHTDPDTGDLWLGQDERGESCATTITNVSTGLSYLIILILTMNSTVARCDFATIRADTERFHLIPASVRSGGEL